jgi:hypothetical protein
MDAEKTESTDNPPINPGTGLITFSRLARELGRSPFHLKRLIRQFDLYLPPHTSDPVFSPAYTRFIQKLLWLEALHVPMQGVVDLFTLERKILTILRVHTLTSSPTWYLDYCTDAIPSESRLLLSHFNLSDYVQPQGIQGTLDFSNESPELFTGAEMGEDILKVLASYRELRGELLGRIRTTIPALEQALLWADDVLTRSSPV